MNTRRNIGRFAGGKPLGPGHAHFPDHHQTGMDADAHGQADVLARQQTRAVGDHRGHDGQAALDGAARVVFVRIGVTEIRQHPVAQVLRDMPVEARNHRAANRMVGVQDVAKVFRVEPGRQGRGADQVAEHHGQMAPLGMGRVLQGRGCSHHRSIGRG